MKTVLLDSARRRRLTLAVVMAVAFLLRLALGLAVPRTLGVDESAYLILGRHLLTSYSLSNPQAEVFYPPMNPVILGGLSHFFSDPERPGEVSSATFGALLILPVYLLALRMYGSRTALLAGAFLAVFPALSAGVLHWGTMTEPPYLFFLWTGLLALLTGLEESSLPRFFFSGLLLSFAYLTRPEGIVYFLVFLIFVALRQAFRLRGQGYSESDSAPYSRSAWLSQLTYPIALFVFGFALGAAPYVYFLHVHTGGWMVSTKSALVLNWHETGDTLQDAQANDRIMAQLDPRTGKLLYSEGPSFRSENSLLSTIAAHPREFLGRIAYNVHVVDWKLFDKGAFWFGLLPLVTLGLFQYPWDRRRLARELFLLASALPVCSFLIYYIALRLLTPLFVVLLLWTAKGTVQLGDWLVQTCDSCRLWPRQPDLPRRVLPWLPALAVCGFFLATSFQIRPALFAGYKQAGLWLRKHTDASARVMAPTPIVPAYADREQVLDPRTDWENLLRYAQAQGATYWVTNDWRLTKLRPQLAFLLSNPPPQLELMFSCQEDGRRTLVYRILGGKRTAGAQGLTGGRTRP